MLQPWKKISSKPLADYRIFKVRTDVKECPASGKRGDFYVIESSNWVNVVAVTPDDHLVMVEQYRHGSDTIELEVPGGIIDPHDPSPVEAGVRELREETGYEGEHARIIGRVFANPAIMNNSMFTVMIEHCHLRHQTTFDHHEDLVTRLVPAAEIPGLIRAGRISHPLVAVALYHFDLLRRR
jgi:8-oxo-dGTP pyrophosphatase MutT (NUDIX family)